MEFYNQLTKKFSLINELESIRSLLSWDQEIMMPEYQLESRIKQMNSMHELESTVFSDPELENTFSKTEKNLSHLKDWEQKNFFEMKKKWEDFFLIPSSLKQNLSELQIKTFAIWVNARKTSQYDSYLESLNSIIELTKEIAQIRAEHYKTTPYSALIKIYDPDLDENFITPIMDEVKAFITQNLSQAINNSTDIQLSDLPTYSIAEQKKITSLCMDMLGANTQWSRVDEGAHPMMVNLSNNDIRIVTNYKENNFLFSFYAILHELGHALYEHNLPSYWYDQPVGKAMSTSLHESQSLFAERHLGLHPDFIKYMVPFFNSLNLKNEKKLTVSDFLNFAHKVEPSLIRIEADEFTYPLHILIRYEIEQKIFSENLKASEINDLWNQLTYDYLNIKVQDDYLFAQDVHWAVGDFGYFPSYLLGSVVAAQLWEHSAQKKIQNLNSYLSSGDLSSIMQQMTEDVHKFASAHDIHQIVQNATGEKINTKSYFKHLTERYLT